MDCEPTDEEVYAARVRIREEWNRKISEEMWPEILEETRNRWGVQATSAALGIIHALEGIPETLPGQYGPKPIKNIHLMQYWLYVELFQLNNPELPMKSFIKPSILGSLSEKGVTLGGKNVFWSEDNWKRILDNANRLINANKELKEATNIVSMHVDMEKYSYRMRRPDYKTYLRNQRKESRRWINRKTQPFLDKIKNNKQRKSLAQWIESWSDKYK